MEYSHFKQECLIDVADYDCDTIKFQKLTNTSFLSLIKEEDVDGMPPSMVRWINIAGIDWSILRAIALKYSMLNHSHSLIRFLSSSGFFFTQDIHSLALEDILHERGHTHSKADYYPNHLFIRILCHSLDQASDTPSISTPITISAASDNSSQHPNEVHPYPDVAYECNEGQQDVDILIGSDDSKLLSEMDAESISFPKAKDQDSTSNFTKGKKKDKQQSSSRRHWYSSLTKRLTALSGHDGPVSLHLNVKEI